MFLNAASTMAKTRLHAVPTADPHYDSVVLLLPLNDADAATATTDFSSYAHTPFTFTNQAQIDTAQSKFGTSSLILDGSADYITIPDHSSFTVGSGDFTAECHIRFNALPSASTEQGHCMMAHYKNTNNQRSWFLSFTETDEIEFFWSANGTATFSVVTTNAPTLVTGIWYHVAMCRDGTNIRILLDGIELTNTGDAIGTTALHNSTEAPRIGELDSSAGFTRSTDGWIDNVRITVGIARYKADFVPPRGEYPTTRLQLTSLPDTSDLTYDSVSSDLGVTVTTDIIWNDDGTEAWIPRFNSVTITGWSASPAYDVTALTDEADVTVSLTSSGLRGIAWNDDGTQVYLSEYYEGDMHMWTVSPAYDLSSISGTADSVINFTSATKLLSFNFVNNGNYILLSYLTPEAGVELFSLSTAYDISTATSDATATLSASSSGRSDEAIMSEDGTRLWQIGLTSEDIHQWTLSTPYDLSTISWDGATKDLDLNGGGTLTNPLGMHIPSGRNELYVVWYSNPEVVEKYTWT